MQTFHTWSTFGIDLGKVGLKQRISGSGWNLPPLSIHDGSQISQTYMAQKDVYWPTMWRMDPLPGWNGEMQAKSHWGNETRFHHPLRWSPKTAFRTRTKTKGSESLHTKKKGQETNKPPKLAGFFGFVLSSSKHQFVWKTTRWFQGGEINSHYPNALTGFSRVFPHCFCCKPQFFQTVTLVKWDVQYFFQAFARMSGWKLGSMVSKGLITPIYPKFISSL